MKKLEDKDLQERIKIYHQKNKYFEDRKREWMELDTDTFLHLIFCRDKDEDPTLLPFEKTWCEAYEWWTHHQRESRRPPELSFVYNGICQAIYGRKKQEKNKTYILTSNYDKLREIMEHPFVIMSPISYIGKRRTKSNARYLYAMVIDIDSVDADNIANLLYQTDKTRPDLQNGYVSYPQPNIIVNSGNGIHIYYLLETPVPMFKDTYEILNKIKRELTLRAWNKGITHEDPKDPQIQGNCQGFRLPGTQTKFYTKVRAFRNLSPNVPPYYKIADLAKYGAILTPEESALLEKGTYNPHRVTLKEAREMYPEWYERRIIKKMRSNRWIIKRDLYDWFKRQIYQYARVGHRYFCCMALSIYAKKCNIDEEELDADLKELVGFLNAFSYTKKDEDQFTIEDAMDAKSAFQESYCTFPRDDISTITGVPMKENRRNGLKQEVHLNLARQKQKTLREIRQQGDWRENNGRIKKKELILEWQSTHNTDEYRQVDCARDLSIDIKTVRKWWCSEVWFKEARIGRTNAEMEIIIWRHNNPNGTKAQCIRDLGLSKPTVYKWWDKNEI